MQMKYDSSGVGQVALPRLHEFKPAPRTTQRRGQPTQALWADCQVVLHDGFGEKIVWGLLSAGSLMAIGVSFLG